MRTGSIDISQLDPLEQADFIAYERRELELRFTEQANLVYCTSASYEAAKARIDLLKGIYWVEEQAQRADRDMLDTDTLLELQQKTFVLTNTGQGARLEIRG